MRGKAYDVQYRTRRVRVRRRRRRRRRGRRKEGRKEGRSRRREGHQFYQYTCIIVHFVTVLEEEGSKDFMK